MKKQINNINVEVGNWIMDLLNYTKKLYDKIKFYDSIAQNTFSGLHSVNPFAKPINITIVWVEEENDD